MLLAKGATVDAAISNGATPLYVASASGHEGIVGMLEAA
jgi:ankyrin repeat protein